MPWIQTTNDRVFDYEDFEKNRIDVAEATLALSRLNRYAGHGKMRWTVLDHSLLCEYIARHRYGEEEERLRLHALTHDLHEAYMGDSVSPLKRVVPELAQFEKRLEASVLNAIGVMAHERTHDCDIHALFVEREFLFGTPPAAWSVEDPFPPSVKEQSFFKMVRDTPDENKRMAFLCLFHSLRP